MAELSIGTGCGATELTGGYRRRGISTAATVAAGRSARVPREPAVQHVVGAVAPTPNPRRFNPVRIGERGWCPVREWL